jgi:hypothetical protein
MKMALCSFEQALLAIVMFVVVQKWVRAERGTAWDAAETEVEVLQLSTAFSVDEHLSG